MVEMNIFVVLSLFLHISASIDGAAGDTVSNEDLLHAIDARFEEFRNEIDRLKEREIEHKEREVEQQRRLDLLAAELDDQKAKAKELENRVEALTKQRENSEGSFESNNQNVDQKGPTVKSLVQKQTVRTRRQNDVGPIAFFATLGSHLTHAGVHQDIVFEKVETNEGNSYSPVLGTFTAPVAGTYVFSVTLTAYSTFTSHYSICINHKSVSWLVVRGETAPNAVASQTDILVLQKGDIVTVQNQDADKNLHGYTYSSFAGFLLHENEPLTVVG